jgi:hypothetical protein
MALLNTTFNTNDLPQSENNFEPLPAGWYQVKVSGAELKNTKAGNGQYIAVRYDVLGPTHQGRVVFGNINVHNPNPEAERIGREQLGNLMRAIGLTEVSDTDQLIGGQCEVKLSVRKSEEYGDSNDTKAWKSSKGSVAPAATQSAPAAAKAPWQK